MIGTDFPKIELLDQSGTPFGIENISQKFILLYFYPKDMTPGCTTQAIAIRDDWERLQSLNCSVIGVSKDSPKKHLSFIEKYDLPFQLLSDPNGLLCEKFGVWIEKSMFGRKYMGIERSSFLYDSSRKLIQKWKKVKPSTHLIPVIDYLKNNI